MSMAGRSAVTGRKPRDKKETIRLLREKVEIIREGKSSNSYMVSGPTLSAVIKGVEQLWGKMSGPASEGEEFTFRFGNDPKFLRSLYDRLQEGNRNISAKEANRFFKIHRKYLRQN